MDTVLSRVHQVRSTLDNMVIEFLSCSGNCLSLVSVMSSYKKTERGVSYKHLLPLSLSTLNRLELLLVIANIMCMYMDLSVLPLSPSSFSTLPFSESPIKNHASMVTTEISQVPFTGVLEILKMAK